MKLDYLTLLGSEPVYIKDIGSVKSPTLRDVRKLGFENYNMYMAILNFDKKQFIKVFNLKDQTIIDKEYFDIVFDSQEFREMFYNIFSFFMCEKVYVDIADKCYVLYVENPKPKNKNDKQLIVGIIRKDNFEIVKDIILQFNYCNNDDIRPTKPAGKHTAELLEKSKKYKEKFAEQNKEADKDISLPNIISKVATYSNSINFLNIWDLTIFQIFDMFATLSNKQITDMCNMSYSVWGGNHDIPKWYKSTYKNI